uniref:Uncharacterized protein n=1 Tax=Anguilla anguilla TaxID=7936 RepID=A0A0E9VWL0_ANGAN
MGEQCVKTAVIPEWIIHSRCKYPHTKADSLIFNLHIV